ncbi:hypothetical protein D920_02921 [Enterococcus faecalis 13-SD-W-01]|nr:hypothetical protein D920_02921 [Enterococcus faecalis 13-SD-W-01]
MWFKIKNTTPYQADTGFAKSYNPVERVLLNAISAASGSNVEDNKNPPPAASQLLPACCPKKAGKIRFPAPKNIPKIKEANKTKFFVDKLFMNNPHFSLVVFHFFV